MRIGLSFVKSPFLAQVYLLYRHTPVLEGKYFYNPVYSKSKMLEDDSSVQKLYRRVLARIHIKNYIFISYHLQLVCPSPPYCSILRYDTV